MNLLAKDNEIRSKCADFHSAVLRVESLSFVGDPKEGIIYRAATYVYNKGVCTGGVIRSIANENDDALEVGKFLEMNVYIYMLGKPTLKKLLSAGKEGVLTGAYEAAKAPDSSARSDGV